MKINANISDFSKTRGGALSIFEEHFGEYLTHFLMSLSRCYRFFRMSGNPNSGTDSVRNISLCGTSAKIGMNALGFSIFKKDC